MMRYLYTENDSINLDEQSALIRKNVLTVFNNCLISNVRACACVNDKSMLIYRRIALFLVCKQLNRRTTLIFDNYNELM